MTAPSQRPERVARTAFAPVDEDALFRRLTVTTDETSDPSFLAEEVKDATTIRENFSNAMSALADVPPAPLRHEPSPSDEGPTEPVGGDVDVAAVRQDPALLLQFLRLGPIALQRAAAKNSEAAER